MVPTEEWVGALKDSGTFHSTGLAFGVTTQKNKLYSMSSPSRASPVNSAWGGGGEGQERGGGGTS